MVRYLGELSRGGPNWGFVMVGSCPPSGDLSCGEFSRVGSCSGGAWPSGELSRMGILPDGELSRWELSWWGVVLVGSCSGGGLACSGELS